MIKRFTQINPLAFLSATIILYILRMAAQYINYVFIPFLLIYFLFTVYHFAKKNTSVKYTDLFRFNLYLILVSLMFIWGFLISARFILPVIKELLNIIIILFLFSSLFLFVKNKESFDSFNEIFCKQIVIFSSLLALFGLVKFYFQFKGIEFLFLNLPNEIKGTSLTTDYNFYILFSFISIISILFGLKYFINGKKFFSGYLLVMLLFILSINIVFSYSRRGFIFLLLLLLFCCYVVIAEYKKKSRIFYVISTYLAAFLLFTFILLAFLFKIPVPVKRNVINTLGFNIRSYRYLSSTLLYRYSTIVSKAEYSHFYNVVWTEMPNSLDPNSGWDFKNGKQVFPLTGENVNIVPEKSLGYRMDSTCDAVTWGNNAYSYTDISMLFKGDTILKPNEFYSASVYCYVSDNFDGSWARISAEGGATGKTIHTYDLNKKASWQKLTIIFKHKGVLPPVYLYWAKNGRKDFRNLKGYIIFAYPEYRNRTADPRDPDSGWGGDRISSREFPLSGENSEIVPENSIGYKMDRTCDASTWNNNAYSFTNILCLFQNDIKNESNENFYSSVNCFVSKDFDGSWAHLSAEGGASGKTISEYDLTRKGSWQKLQIEFTSKTGVPPVYLYWARYGEKDFKNLKGYVIFAYPEYFKKSGNVSN